MAKFSYQKTGSSYRTQIRVNGKRLSITAPTVTELKQRVAEARICHETQEKAPKIDFKNALDKLLISKSNVLSPNTMMSYKAMSKQLVPLYKENIYALDKAKIQAFINDYAVSHSPKSCANLYSFLMTVIKFYRDVDFSVKLPQKKKPDLIYPNEDDMKLLIDNADEQLKRGLLILCFAPSRRGEACAVKYSDIDGNTIHIHATIALDEEYSYKDTPKTSAGDRFVQFPEEIIKELGTGDPEEFVVGLTPQALYNRFRRLCKKLGLPPYRLHSTRVFGASYFHNVAKLPDAAIMERGGWNTATCLQNIYRKNLTKDEVALDSISSFFDKK